MKIIIIGAGRTGQSLIKDLAAENHDIVVIDVVSSLVQDMIEKYDINGLVGNGCLSSILEEAGVATCDLLISVTEEDEKNILACLVGKRLGAKHAIAQARDPEYYTNFDSMGDKMGIARFVNAEATMSDRITRILKAPAEVSLSPFGGGRLELAEFVIPEGDRICGKTLLQVRENKKKDFLVISIQRDGEIFVPNGNTVIQDGDMVTICVRHQEMRDVLGYFGIGKSKVTSVMILGTRESTFYTASMLIANGMKVKVIGKMKDECEALKTRLPELNVVCDDYNNKEVLLREGLDEVDALVAMAPSDEKNIVASLYAKTRNIEKVVTVVSTDIYHDMLEDIELNLVLSPYALVGSSIAMYVRSINVPEGSQIVAMHSMAEGRAESMQFNVGNNEKFVGKTVGELSSYLRKNVLLCAILRKRTTIIPHGGIKIEEDDNIVIFTVGNTIRKLEDLLK